MTVELRRAVPADIEPLLAFWVIAAEGTDRVDSADAVRQLLARDPDALLLAVDGTEIVGSLIAGWDGWRCHLYRFAVHPQRRRRGIGRALIDAAEARFAELGGHRADAMVLDDNTPAHGSWSAAGYRRQPEWSRWVKALASPSTVSSPTVIRVTTGQ
ncbi:ribosomal protein S18 acetylase RimI-like enzyme [Allocatelliglobosispora scoriae]|uniref:Ribosomal protein S18 acetylase RimI-like enzyme n=1 Tax=Allocatelliglobosispora scoriae TaxID=643052 RepID=A0A841BQD9_9ACTN|nr:GNAT family N-acetyltransferase [Allocatelliglobosispora scoriae]MBB5869153.1 ribosomal protein S18 acetylase RimI-like enzyme [Allocatelliglobosispora scoriae]